MSQFSNTNTVLNVSCRLLEVRILLKNYYSVLFYTAVRVNGLCICLDLWQDALCRQ